MNRHSLRFALVSLLATCCVLSAQEPPQPPPPPGLEQGQAPPPADQSPSRWRHFGGSPGDPVPAPAGVPGGPPPMPGDPMGGQRMSQQPRSQQPMPIPEQPMPGAPLSLPPQLTIRPGTFVTVRINQMLSSDHNQPGDAFSATLERPLVVDGVIVAQRGQTIAGRVTEVLKAGRVKGTSRLGLQLTELSLVDGQQVTIQSQYVTRTGSTSYGRDAAAIGETTAAGAAIGAIADGGVGAGIGAAAGLAASTVGVMLTRGRATEVYPEMALTFRIEAPITISTQIAPYAFRFVNPEDYSRSYNAQLRSRPPAPTVIAPPPYYYSGYYGPYPYFYGPSFSLFYGRGFYGPRYYGPYRRW